MTEPGEVRGWGTSSRTSASIAPDAVIDALDAAVVVADGRGIIQRWNAAAARLLSWTGDEASGRPLTDLIEPHLGAGEATGVLAQVAGGSSWRRDVPLASEKAQSMVLDVSISPILRDGQVAGMALLAWDVSERSEVAAMLGLRAERLRRFVAHSSEVVITLEEGRRIAFASGAVERVLGTPPADLVGTEVTDLVHPDDLAVMTRALEHRPAAAGARPVEVRLRCADASWCWTEVAVTDLRGEAGSSTHVLTIRDATERRRAVEALRLAEERFRSFFAQAPIPEGMATLGGRITAANAALSRLLGYDDGELVGQSINELLDPEDARPDLADYGGLLRGTQDSLQHERRLRRKDGSWIHASIGVSLVRDEKGEPSQFAAIVLDITARKEAEDALRASEHRHRALVQHSADAAFVIAPSGEVLYASPAITAVLGWDVADAVGATSWELIHRDDLPAVREAFQRALASPGLHPPLEFRVRHADGSWRWVEEVMTNLVDHPYVHGVVANLRDVSRRKADEQSLRGSEARYRQIVEAAGEGIWMLDRDGHSRFANPRMAEMLGCEPDELVGRSIFDFVSGDDADWMRSQLGNPAAGAEPAEILFSRMDETESWALAVVSPFPGDDGDSNDDSDCVMLTATDVTRRKQAEDELRWQGLRDGLTGLPNRVLLLDRVEQALRRSGPGNVTAVLLVDLDQFKLINDSLGRGAGDELLKQTAERLSQAVLPTATVARLGGDEFGVLCEGLDDARDAVAVAARIHDSLAPPVLLDGTEVYISASIGVASAHDLDAERLLRDADSAMSRAKDLGRSRTEMFDVTLRGAAEARLRMRTELRQALEREEFVLHFQPIIDLATEHVVGLEALVRWNHPQRGLVPPLEFIPVAEETGIIADLGDWVLAETCRALRDMPPSAPGHHPLQASVNLSARQISRPDVVERVARVIEATGVDPSRLVLEVTESAVMEDAEAALQALVALKSLGVRLAIDDFGTGYSSLVYLKRFPVDELKIDRSFVDGLCADADDAAIVASVISLAGSVGLRAVAEGVETSGQLLALRDLGCDLAQGYFWSRPLPVAELREFIARR